MKKRILLDMDGVMADVYRRFIELEYKRSGRRISYDDLDGNNILRFFPDLSETLHQKGFFRDLPLMDGVQDGVEYLNSKYELYIVTAAIKLPNCRNILRISARSKLCSAEARFPFVAIL